MARAFCGAPQPGGGAVLVMVSMSMEYLTNSLTSCGPWLLFVVRCAVFSSSVLQRVTMTTSLP